MYFDRIVAGVKSCTYVITDATYHVSPRVLGELICWLMPCLVYTHTPILSALPPFYAETKYHN